MDIFHEKAYLEKWKNNRCGNLEAVKFQKLPMNSDLKPIFAVKRFSRLFVLFLVIFCLFWLYYIMKDHSTPIVDTEPYSEYIEEFKELKEDLIEYESPKQYPNYYDDDLRPTWKFKITKNYANNLLRQWTESNGTIDAMHVFGPGENGTAFIPMGKDIALMEKLRNENNFNFFASDKISLHRTLPDYRYPECRNLSYPEKLPTTSIIIVLHNEAWSTLLRTIWSIIDRSPRELLEEIILVDDASTWYFLKRPLDDYIDTLPVRAKIIRMEKREGLIRARLIGAKKAKGSVLTFFDAHMECSKGWLQPVLSRIAYDRSVVVVPYLDSINIDDMSYREFPFTFTRLRWPLQFYWFPIPERELLRTNYDRTAPIRTPTHVGCAFSVDREFFFEIGSYDAGMDIWGGENVELAFRTWLCGGSLEVLPCSRVAHLYRSSTYSFNGDKRKITMKNDNRLVSIWLDEFKDIFYAASPEVRKISPGNLTERINLKNRLQCKNFRWYLENIYPESNWLKEFIRMGALINVAEKLCLDVQEHYINMETSYELMVRKCHNRANNQFFAFTKSGQIISPEDFCLGVNENQKVVLVICDDNDDSNLWWSYEAERQWILHKETNLCMRNDQTEIILDECNSFDDRFKWNFIAAQPEKLVTTENTN